MHKQKNPTLENLDLMETATHEAAHIVTAIYFGFPITGKVSIRGDSHRAGVSKIGKPKGYHDDWPNVYFLGEQEIVVNLAGTEAVKLFREEMEIQNEGDFGDGDDIYQARRCFRDIESLFTLTETEEEFLQRLRSFTRDVVTFFPIHDAITALANNLSKTNSLSANRSKFLVKMKLGHLKGWRS